MRKSLTSFFFLVCSMMCEGEGLVLGDPDYAPEASLEKKEAIRPRWTACRRAESENRGNSPSATIKEETEKTDTLPSEDESLHHKTEAEFCFSCQEENKIFTELKETSTVLNSTSFKQKLQKRLAGRISAKIFQTRLLRACLKPDRQWFAQWEPEGRLSSAKALAIEETCKAKKDELEDSIQRLWPEMRIHLALASTPHQNQEMIRLPLQQAPSHLSGFFEDMPPLSPEEETQARHRYANHLMPVFASTPLQKMSHEELREEITNGRPLVEERGSEMDKKFLTVQEHSHFREETHQALLDLRGKSRERYFEIITDMPLLGRLKSGQPDSEELNEAFLSLEENLKAFLKKTEEEDTDMALLFSFEPLVEEILQEHPELCLTAEKLKRETEAQENLEQTAFLGAVVVAALPCFMTGPVGFPLCLAGGLATGYVGYQRANSQIKESFGRVLTGKEFETIAELKTKEKDAFIAKMLIPLAFWGTTAGTLKTAVSVFSKSARTGATKTHPTLGQGLKQDQRSHSRTAGQEGLDPETQREILRRTGFSESQIPQPARGKSPSRKLSPARIVSFGPILAKNFPAGQIRHFNREKDSDDNPETGKKSLSPTTPPPEMDL